MVASCLLTAPIINPDHVYHVFGSFSRLQEPAAGFLATVGLLTLAGRKTDVISNGRLRTHAMGPDSAPTTERFAMTQIALTSQEPLSYYTISEAHQCQMGKKTAFLEWTMGSTSGG